LRVEGPTAIIHTRKLIHIEQTSSYRVHPRPFFKHVHTKKRGASYAQPLSHNFICVQRSLRRVREVLHTSVSLHSQQNVFNTKSCLSMYDSKAYDSIEAFNQMQFDHALSRQLQSVQIRARLPLRMYFPSPRAHFKSDAFMGQTWVGVSRVLS